MCVPGNPEIPYKLEFGIPNVWIVRELNLVSKYKSVIVSDVNVVSYITGTYLKIKWSWEKYGEKIVTLDLCVDSS